MIKYLSIRIIAFIIVLIVLSEMAYYTLPKHIREDGYGFIEETDSFFKMSLAFTIISLLFVLNEANKFNKKNFIILRNSALGLACLFSILTISFAILNYIY